MVLCSRFLPPAGSPRRVVLFPLGFETLKDVRRSKPHFSGGWRCRVAKWRFAGHRERRDRRWEICSRNSPGTRNCTRCERSKMNSNWISMPPKRTGRISRRNRQISLLPSCPSRTSIIAGCGRSTRSRRFLASPVLCQRLRKSSRLHPSSARGPRSNAFSA